MRAIWQQMILFLDFDGVLHPGPCASAEMFCCLPRLENVLHDYPSVDIVISSTSAKKTPLTEILAPFSKSIADRILGHTPHHRTIACAPELDEYPRHAEVLKWLHTNGRMAACWIALDDQPDRFLPNAPVVHCNTRIGFDEHAERDLRARLDAWAEELRS